VAAETETQTRDAITNIGYHLTDEILHAVNENNRSSQNIALILCWAAVESTLNPDAIGTGKERERGLFQLKPSTAREVEPKVTIRQLYNPVVNTRIATQVLQSLVNKYGDVRTALVVYKEGAGNYRSMGETTNSSIYADGIIGCSTRPWSVPWR